MGVTLNSVSSTRRQAVVEYLLLDSGAQLHACPIPGQKVPVPDPGIHCASGARLHTTRRRTTGVIQITRRTDSSSAFPRVCSAETNSVPWPSRSAGVLLFFPDKTQTKRSHTQLHKEESLFFVKGMLVAPLSTAGVSDQVGQELQMPTGPQMLEDVEEPVPARPATGTHHQIVMEEDNLTHLSESTLVRDVRRISRSRTVENRCSCASADFVPEAFCRLRASSWEQTTLLEPSL